MKVIQIHLMLLPEIKEIEQRRIKMGFTIRLFVNTINNLGGKEEKDQLSPAWLNQVERGKIPNPSYFKIKQIFDFLECEEMKKQITAEELCVPHKKFKKISKSETTMEFCKLGTPILDVHNIMTKYGISQMPVLENGYCLGMITSNTVFDLVFGSKLAKIYVDKKFLDHNYNTVNVKTPLNSIRRILKHFDYALVEKEGIIHGILVKDDLINELK
jgi:predicted transcriptional regulator